MKFIWEPCSRKQELIIKDETFELLAGGARGGTKSESGRVKLIKPFMTLKPEQLKQYRALIVRKNSEDLKGWIDKSKPLFQPFGAEYVGRPVEVRFPNGTIFWTGHLADDKSFEKYQGNEYQRMNFEELTQIASEDLYLKVLGSCRSTVPDFSPQVYTSCNPGGIGHYWVKKRWAIPDDDPPYDVIYQEIKREIDGVMVDRSRKFIPATVEDNPILMKNDPGYVMFLESLPEQLSLMWRWGAWNVFAGQFFDLKAEHRYEIDHIPDTWQLWGGMDYGTGPKNATAFGLYARDSTNNRIIRVAEYYNHELSAPEYAREIKYFLEDLEMTSGRMPKETFCDPSMWTKVKVSEAYAPSPIDSFDFLNPVPANNDRVNGWRQCKQILNVKDGECGFGYIPGLNPAFEEYLPLQVHAKNNPEDLQKCDIDHVCDEFRYAIMGAIDEAISIASLYPEKQKNYVTTMNEVF